MNDRITKLLASTILVLACSVVLLDDAYASDSTTFQGLSVRTLHEWANSGEDNRYLAANMYVAGVIDAVINVAEFEGCLVKPSTVIDHLKDPEIIALLSAPDGHGLSLDSSAGKYVRAYVQASCRVQFESMQSRPTDR